MRQPHGMIRWWIPAALLAGLLAGGSAYHLHRRARQAALNAEKERPPVPPALDRQAAGGNWVSPAVEAPRRACVPAPPAAPSPSPPSIAPAVVPTAPRAVAPGAPAGTNDVPEARGETIRVEPREDGVLVWEAEWANRVLGSWECLPAQDSGGGAALWARDGSGRSIYRPFRPRGDDVFDLGLADYAVRVPKVGRYRVLARAWAPDACGDSCWVTLDGGEPHAVPENILEETGEDETNFYRRWRWMGTKDPGRELSAGVHWLRLEVREDGFAVDQLALAPEGVVLPSQPLGPSLLPGRDGWPPGLKLSGAGPGGRGEDSCAPLEAALAAESRVLTPDGAPSSTLWLWVRANSPEPATLRLQFSAPGAQVLPAPVAVVSLSPVQPLARVAFRVVYPPDVARRGHEARATLTAAAQPDLKIERELTLWRPFTWRALGPLDDEQQRVCSDLLKDAKTLSFSAPLPQGKPLPPWKTVEDLQLDEWGALDLNKVFGESRHCAAFLATHLHVGRTGKYCLLAGADDGLIVRLDGNRLLAQRPRPARDLRPLSDLLRFYEVELQEGAHWLLALVTQEDKFWEMRLEFRGADGRPSADVWGLPAEP